MLHNGTQPIAPNHSQTIYLTLQIISIMIFVLGLIGMTIVVVAVIASQWNKMKDIYKAYQHKKRIENILNL